MAQRPNITVRVLPDGEEFHAGLHGAFVSFGCPDLPPIVSRIRDTKDRAGGTLFVSAAAWRALLRKTSR